MEEKKDAGMQPVAKASLPWWLGGLLLGLIMVLAVWAYDPLGVSTQFVILDTKIIQHFDAEYVAEHPVISKDKYQSLGYGFWLDIGLLGGALIAALVVGRWKLQTTCSWWDANHGKSPVLRFITGFIGGILILFGSRVAGGCTSGMMASGWVQLAVNALPFTIGLFIAGIFVARLVYPKSPEIEK
ncbi:MAG: YeeE/YedE family protein [Planctomycetes bacterium]|nr:YeeE/YedE family protein [Planctomycetota bacterium]